MAGFAGPPIQNASRIGQLAAIRTFLNYFLSHDLQDAPDGVPANFVSQKAARNKSKGNPTLGNGEAAAKPSPGHSRKDEMNMTTEA